LRNALVEGGKRKTKRKSLQLLRRSVMEDVKRILVVSRDTQYDRKAVHYGFSLARQYGAKLYVMHAVHNPFSLQGWNLPIPSLVKEGAVRRVKLLRSAMSKQTPGGKPIYSLLPTVIEGFDSLAELALDKCLKRTSS
jgi:hypothetical protein